jgi:hypothetical protein
MSEQDDIESPRRIDEGEVPSRVGAVAGAGVLVLVVKATAMCQQDRESHPFRGPPVSLFSSTEFNAASEDESEPGTSKRRQPGEYPVVPSRNVLTLVVTTS